MFNNKISNTMMNSNVTDKGVVINGVKWATRNVATPGTFAANPEVACKAETVRFQSDSLRWHKKSA